MTIIELHTLCENLIKENHGDKEATFLCPDGCEDLITSDFETQDKSILFLNYKHRSKIASQ